MSSKKRETAIEKEKTDGGPLTRTSIVNMVFKAHQSFHHYSIKTQKPELYKKILLEVKDMPLAIVKESYDIYKEKKNSSDNKIPHPNYFLKVCKRKYEEYPEKHTKILWGKEI